jgi:hypothetical protein
MENNKKLYIYSGIAIAGAIVVYLLLTNKKPNGEVVKSNEEETPQEDVEETVVTDTGDEIDTDQVEIPKTLKDILDKSVTDANKLLVNKPIYTKLKDVIVRNENYVNNGIINNIESSITNIGTFLGKVTQVVEDKGKMKNLNGRVYKWLKIKLSDEAITDLNNNRSFLSRNLTKATAPFFSFYVREDTIKLER